MDLRGRPSTAGIESIVDDAAATVTRWLAVIDVEAPAAEARLSRVLCDENATQFAADIVDLVIRPEHNSVAAKNFERLSSRLPANVNWREEVGAHVAGGFAQLLPSALVPMVREKFLKDLGHLVVRGDSEEIEKQVEKLAASGGIRPTVAPITAVASGHRERHRQVTAAHALLERAGVDAILLDPASFLGRAKLIDLDAEVEAAVDLLSPLYATAAQSEHPKLIDLDVSTLDELEVSLRIFERMMTLHPNLNMGISLPACLPESLPALVRVIDRARTRCAAGGSKITVRITRGENVERERALANRHGWNVAPFTTRTDTDAHYFRLLNCAITPESTSVVQVISATHNLFAVALAWRLAHARGVEGSVEHEFRLGVATAHREAVKRDVGGVRLYTPVEQTGLLPLVAPYLARRIVQHSEEQGSGAAHSSSDEKKWFARENDSFVSAVRESTSTPIATHRTQATVRTEVADFTVAATREWAGAVLERTRDSASGEALLARSTIRTPDELEALIVDAVSHGSSWGERRGSTRAAVLESVAEVFAEWRGLLVETAVSESAMTLQEADTDVTVAIELARRAAEGSRELDGIRNAVYLPPRLIVVVCSRSTPLTTLADSVLSALGAGSAVIIKAAPEARRSASVFVQTLIAGGVPEGLVTILDDEADLAKALICDPRVDHVLHSGSRHTAKLFHSWRAETRISSTTGGRNSVIVTESADLETAVIDIVKSAVGHAGQPQTSVSTMILVGSAGESARFLGRLSDSIGSIAVAPAGTTGAEISALSRPATARQRVMLETLDEGESWRVQPRQADKDGRLWSPGLRDNVASDSSFRRADNHVPVIGIVRARTLTEAIDIQNELGFGLAAGIYSLDDGEIETWLNSVEAGLLGVNCSVGTAMRGRAPVQGWNRSAVGTVNTGGFDSVMALGEWQPVAIPAGTTVTLEGMSAAVAQLITAAQSGLDYAGFDWVRTGAQSDEEAWGAGYAAKIIVASEFEQIEYRYVPVPVTVRLSEGAPIENLVRVLAAAARTQSAIAISSAIPLHSDLITLFGQRFSPVNVAEVLVESEARWRARVLAGEIATSRIRLIGGDRQILARVLHGRIGIAVHASPVTASGRVELLPFLRGQSICTNMQPLA